MNEIIILYAYVVSYNNARLESDKQNRYFFAIIRYLVIPTSKETNKFHRFLNSKVKF
jgi:hypothetical protein